MDKGAHYRRSDFQIHTPRDRNWIGDPAVTDQERQQYAAEFVTAAREKGLDAVAVTDHHDMAMIPYLRAAAAAERDATGSPVPLDQQLVIFPAMELTLGVPCQAIVIFDADFPDDLFTLAMNALAITPSPATEEKCADIVRLDHITSLSDVYQELDKREYLRGRYTVFPNVSEGGTTTLLRSGHAGHYRFMPCVGGYLDGNVDQLRAGNQRILNGDDAQYGAKALGLFQTSDSRRRDFADLGRSSTWVKWATPTAEALRQACLARESRLSQVAPTVPSTYVTSIDVSNSSFLGPLFLELNPQYSAFIGGRGTGKSTALEYLRWAACDDAFGSDDDSFPSDQRRRKTLIEETLVPLNATIQIRFVVNGVAHAVRRNSATREVSLKIGEGPFEACTEGDVRALLPVQAYSQKQLSNVGVRVGELSRFVRAPVRGDLQEISRELGSVSNLIRAAHVDVRSKRQVERDIANDERELRSLSEQAGSLRSELTGLSPADQAVLDAHSAHESEGELIQRVIDAVDQTRAVISGAKGEVGKLQSVAEASVPDGFPHRYLVQSLLNEASTRIKESISDLETAASRIESLSSPQSDYAVSHETLTRLHEEFQASYEAAKGQSSAHQVQLDQLYQLEARIKTVRARLGSGRAKLATMESPEVKLSEAREQWCILHERRSLLIARECARLTELSGGQIRATLVRGGGEDDPAERLRGAVAGSNIKRDKFVGLHQLIIASDNPIRRLQDVLDELETLSLLNADQVDSGSLPPTPLLAESGLTASDLAKIARKLSSESWIDLCVVPLEDQPQFEYRLREGDYIPFARASAGQQATALLWALLNQEGPPLLIDQPEDDLDNQVLLQVVEQVWKAKQQRQLIFSSHNANVVVNGDAELVVCFDYRVAGEQAGGRVRSQGAIDVVDVRSDIALVMEGGKEAFKLRQDKYGF